jgi:glycolate oxidase iron-sulfur subunit
VHDITQFLVEIGHREDFHEVKLKLTYHDPCHLVRGMGVSQEPRQMLKAIPGIDFVEMAHADECCGAGGTFSLSYYDISRQINDKKLDAAQDTNAQVLVTGCSVCRMHIDDGLSRRQGTIKVRHTAEILAAAYRIPGKEVIS